MVIHDIILLTSVTEERHFHRCAAVVSPKAALPHGDAPLSRWFVVWLVFLPGPVKCSVGDIWGRQRPSPAVDMVVVQTDPKEPGHVHVHEEEVCVMLLVRYGGQITVKPPAVSLGLEPVPTVSNKDVLFKRHVTYGS